MRFLLFLLLSLITFSVGAAQLTEQRVQHWIDTHPHIQGWLDQHEEHFSDEAENDLSFNMEQIFADGIQELRDAGLYEDFKHQVQKAGFDQVDHWINTTQQITLAYMALALENNPHSRQMIEMQLEEIRTSPHIPEDQREMYEAMMESSLAMMNKAEQVPSADKRAVRPHLRQLDELFDMEDDF